MNYFDFNLKVNTDTKTISILPGQDINIFQYVSIEDKNDIIQLALQNAEENGGYNLLKLDMFYNLYIVYMYTDIKFSEEEKNEPGELYDELCSNGIMQAILNAIPSTEREYLRDILMDTLDMNIQRNQSVAGLIAKLIDDLPRNAEAAQKVVDNFDPSKFQRVIDFAKAANGGRDI